MQKIADLFGNRAVLPKKQHRSQRNELIEYFYLGVRPDWDEKKFGKLKVSYIAWKLSYLTVRDLYYLKSVCEDARRRGQSFAKTFFWQIRPEEQKV